ncbi:MAG: AMP-binding protein [Magnetococcales bacterium]|nr:AMP-binding protein [Magnetococcales bacterium]
MIDRYYQKLHQALTPSPRICYRYGEDQRDYGEMHRVICQVKGLLADFNQRPVVIYSQKSFEAYGAIFATILSGNIWVPLSPDLAVNRNLDILKMVPPALVLMDCDLPSQIADHLQEQNIPVWNLGQLAQSPIPPREIPPPRFDPDGIAYIMFTSGSTGTPKGVPMSHLNYIHFIENCLNILPFQSGDVFADYHDFAFDISIFYLFCFPLVQGAIAPVMTPRERVMPAGFMQQNDITVWASVPSVIDRVRKLHPSLNTSIRIHFLCGEPFALPVLNYCQEGMKVPHIYNFYGLTESGVENFHYRCQPGDVERFEAFGFVPIGTPLPGNEVDVSEEGELLLSGCQLTPGYLDGVGADRFFERDGKRWFRTGDLIAHHEGLTFCKGRIDSQIKHRGYRIELMDVEVNLKRHSQIRDVICFQFQHHGRSLLVAVVQMPPGETINPIQLKQTMGDQLPLHMLPDRIYPIDTFPENANGKKDRKAVRERFSEKLLGELTPAGRTKQG